MSNPTVQMIYICFEIEDHKDILNQNPAEILARIFKEEIHVKYFLPF
jgi:hypothetical protein